MTESSVTAWNILVAPLQKQWLESVSVPTGQIEAKLFENVQDSNHTNVLALPAVKTFVFF